MRISAFALALLTLITGCNNSPEAPPSLTSGQKIEVPVLALAGSETTAVSQALLAQGYKVLSLGENVDEALVEAKRLKIPYLAVIKRDILGSEDPHSFQLKNYKLRLTDAESQRVMWVGSAKHHSETGLGHDGPEGISATPMTPAIIAALGLEARSFGATMENRIAERLVAEMSKSYPSGP